jgi:hypothetical protein
MSKLEDSAYITHVAVEAFKVLLDTYYYHPILWKLQAVCKALWIRRPNSLGHKEIKIFDYAVVERCDVWLKGMLGGTRDILLFDSAKPHEAFMGFEIKRKNNEDDDDELDEGVKVFYRIPAGWLQYIYVWRQGNDDDSVFMYLAKQKFCCRQILKKGSVTVGQCRSNIIDERFFIDQYYFHVGVGKCWEESHDVFAEVSLYVNIKHLYKLVQLYAGPYGNVRELIYILRTYENKVQLKNNEGDVVLFSGAMLKKLIKHMLVCKKCNLHLPRYIEMLNDSIERCHPYPTECMNEVNDPDVIHNDIPCFKYILDGDFDNLMQRAYYNAPLEDCANKRLNICTDIIDPFMCCYM